MVNKYSLWGVIIGGIVSIAVLTILLWWMFFRVSYIVYSQDTVIQGNFVITEDQPVMLRDNAKITIKGDAVIAGELICKAGGVHLEVEGFLSIDSEVNCDTDPTEAGVNASGVTIIASGGLMMSPNAVIDSEGSVQIVDGSAKVASSQEQVDHLFDAVESDEGGLQIGPLTNNTSDQDFVAEVPSGTVSHAQPFPFVQIANAQEDAGPELDYQELWERIQAANLSDEESKRLTEILYGSINNALASLGQPLYKNSPSVMDAERFLRDKVYDEVKFSNPFIDLGLKLSPQDFDHLSWLIDQFIAKEGAKEPVVIAGTIRVGSGQKPPEDIDVEDLLKEKLDNERKRPKKVVLNFDFSDQRGVALHNLTIKGPHGVDAASGQSTNCSVTGDDGGDAMRFTGRAHNIRVNNFRIEMGAGGNGATVSTPNNCETAYAKAGNGGKPGNIRLKATGSIQIAGEMVIVPGVGGNGGVARAISKDAEDGCPGNNAGKAEALGGNGGDSKQRIRVSGAVSGIGNVRVTAAHGGIGGNGFARSGNGGNGEDCGCAGGKGGPAIAVGGNGGNAAPSANALSTGGDGGEAQAEAGDGGFGASCKKDEGPAGIGGNGGDATMTPGSGGGGDISGTPGGTISEALAGDGGNGGNGCFEGKGGTPGLGKGGLPGQDGKRMCSASPPVEEDPLVSIGGTLPGSMYEMQVIPYKGSGIPTFLVREAGPDKCAGDHWHGSGKITMINGEVVEDPAIDGCGFGETSVVKALYVPVDHEKMKELYGASVDQYLQPVGGSSEDSSTVVDEGSEEEGGAMIQLCRVGRSWVPCSEVE